MTGLRRLGVPLFAVIYTCGIWKMRCREKKIAPFIFINLKERKTKMDNKQENFMSMCAVVKDLTTTEATVVATVPALANALIDFTFNITVVKGYQTIQDTQLKGWATQKGSRKEDMITKTLKIINALTAYALVSNDEVLKEEVNYSRSRLDGLRDEDVDVVCNLIYSKANLISIISLGDYGLVLADLTAQYAAIGLYTAVKQMPSGKVDERQAAKDGIEVTIGKLRKNLELMDRLVKTMIDPAGEFVKKYFNAREIYDIGVRHEPVVPPVTP